MFNMFLNVNKKNQKSFKIFLNFSIFNNSRMTFNNSRITFNIFRIIFINTRKTFNNSPKTFNNYRIIFNEILINIRKYD